MESSMFDRVERTMIADRNSPSLARWVPLLAGLGVITGLGWLLMLLGSALGVSILAEKDVTPEASTISLSATLWIIASWIVAYFVGALLTARLTGSPSKSVGLMHGAAVWGFGVCATLLLALIGVGGAFGVGTSVLNSAAHAGSAAATGLSNLDARRSDAPRSGIPLLRSTSSLEIEASLKSAARTALTKENATEADRKATADQLAKLDAATLVEASGELLAGRVESAKNVLAIRTDLTRAQIDQLVESTNAKANELRAKIDAAAETAKKYTEVALWLAFVGAALALAASLIGGVIGASVVRRSAVVIETITMDSPALA